MREEDGRHDVTVLNDGHGAHSTLQRLYPSGTSQFSYGLIAGTRPGPRVVVCASHKNLDSGRPHRTEKPRQVPRLGARYRRTTLSLVKHRVFHFSDNK
jgi:hypothetical protein